VHLREYSSYFFDSGIPMKSIDHLAARSRNLPEAATQRGLSLIELMIAMVIGLFLIAVIGVLFVNSKTTYLSQDANSRLQENARFAIELLGRQARMAGAPDIKFTQLGSTNLFAKPPVFAFTGTPIAGVNGASNSSDTITTSYDGTTDCLGHTVTSPVVNLFRINAQKQLECLGNGSATAGVLLDDVEDLQVVYGQPTSSGNYSYLTANVATMSAATAARVCVLLRTKADVNKRANGAQSQTYVDCLGSSVASSDGYLRRAVSMTVNLRNRIN